MRRPAVALAALVLALTGCAASTPQALDDDMNGTLTVYAAASLQASFDEVAEAFTAQHPDVRISPVYDGSSTLATQIAEGAPADVFASADVSTMAKVSEFAPDSAVFTTNTLVIVVPAGNPERVASLADLAGVVTVLCAPEVPCGAASARLLEGADVTVDAASLEQNVTAVLAKVAAGEADAGLVYATDVVGRDDVESIVPEGSGDVVNRYEIAALTDAANPAAADAFVAFVLSEPGQRILADRGFGAP
ncbi:MULTISPECIES: molybdate ABC transporter substrate-binding protein [Microbacterium]|uniref:molybdate ABC transporter substrate-binding protein n=1 Tax=Microbacterium TaxID=33882 RepID=UPI00345040F8